MVRVVRNWWFWLGVGLVAGVALLLALLLWWVYGPVRVSIGPLDSAAAVPDDLTHWGQRLG